MGRRRRGYGTKTTGRRDVEEEEEETAGAEKGAGAVGFGFIIICVYLIIVLYSLFRLHVLIYPYIWSSLSSSPAGALSSYPDAL